MLLSCEERGKGKAIGEKKGFTFLYNDFKKAKKKVNLFHFANGYR
ncbi:Hypothetical protein Minf_1714 [Methylacidiphilum infernorum V4]|uniref:Uncharacterized protein n=1 Tax=Methylacidiphilum infernorum (isolate V4) TaxID=481448 RepID=B3DWV5_METI4|nr:Hypothetical protein Minf_1714 [Methylacidiphilum infernorum V4]